MDELIAYDLAQVYNFILVYEVELLLEVLMYTPLAFRLSNQSYYTYKSTSKLVIIASILLSIWGLSFVHSEKLYLYGSTSQEHMQLRTVVMWMVWLKAYLLVLLGLMLCCVSLAFCFFFSIGELDMIVQQRETLSNLPVVNAFLSQRTRKYDPEKDKDECCVICLEEFQLGDKRQIAQLNCNQKHIFHYECMAEWVKTKSTCPLCK